MKFIIDAHLPASIALYFQGHDVMHTTMLVQGNYASDSVINNLSVLEERILITKDSDFYYSYLAQRKPHKRILVNLGT